MAEPVDFKAKRDEKYLAKYGQYMHEGPMFCLACKHKWVGVAMAGTIDTECPECHSSRGAWVCDIGFKVGEELWTCLSCSSTLFSLTKTHTYCRGCGWRTPFEAMG